MGNVHTELQMSNHSNRNVRLFITEEALEMSGFLSSKSGAGDKVPSPLPQDEKFRFRKDVACVRVLARETRGVAWESRHFVSVFVEEDDDEDVCSKHVILNMALSTPVTVILYEV